MVSTKELPWLSATELAHLIRNRMISPVELMKACLDRIEQINPIINAFVTLVPDLALREAKKAEDAVMRGNALGPLHGIPVGIKDIFSTAGIRTTFGSQLFQNYVPQSDSETVRRLKAAGAIVVGKTNTPESAHRGTTENLLFGYTRNPWNLDRTVGGSSGGSAAAVAAGLVPIADGTDSGGSIRIPAAMCGITGFMATNGRIPWDIVNVFASTAPFQHIGPLTRKVQDSILVYQTMAGYDPQDPFSFPTYENAVMNLEQRMKSLKVAYSPDLGYSEIDSQVRQASERAAEVFASMGCQVDRVDMRLVDPQNTVAAVWKRLWTCFQATIYADLSEQQLAMVDPVLQEIIKTGSKMSAVEYVKANFGRQYFWFKLLEIHKKFDIFILPTTAIPAFPLMPAGPSQINGVPIDPFIGWNLTSPFNLSGNPGISVPCGFSTDGLPIGLQIIGRRLEESVILQAALAFERITPYSNYRPPI